MDSKFGTQTLGLNETIVRDISAQKNEPAWMLDTRLKALKFFMQSPMPDWGPNLNELDPQNIRYYVKAETKTQTSWEQVPEAIKRTFEHLGLPAAEQRYLAGLGAQYESDVVYHNLKQEWADQGVIFLDTDTALKEYPEIFKQYFGTIVPFNDNKFAALNTACWSGGTFIYVPPKVQITIPLQAYFRIEAERMGQFERTLIIADQDSLVTYVEGCTAPAYSSSSLHSAVVEIVAMANSRVRYYTIQNWSKNVYNLVTKRALAKKNSVVEWIDGNLGSKITMKYPAVILSEDGARAEILSIAMASSQEQIQDSGARVIHAASNTSSKITSKSVSKKGGRSSYRGLVKITSNAQNCKSFVQCDALMLDGVSRSDAYPCIQVKNNKVNVGHEASVSRIDDELLFYLTSRGIGSAQAKTLIVNGFVEPFVKELPMEFAVEMNRLIQLEVEDSVG